MFEKMTKRERTLAMLVAFLVPVVLLFMIFFWFLGKYNANDMRVIGLRSDIEKATTLFDEAQKAKQRLVYYQELSLPSSLSEADIVLKEWVNNLATETNMKFVSLKPREQHDLKSDSRSPVKIGKVRTSSFRLEGTLDQIVDFLYRFYSFGALKRITSIQLTPKTIGGEGPNKTTRSGRFALDVDFDAVFLNDVDKDKEVGKTAIALARTFDEYKNQIGQRNVFAPANNPPVLPGSIKKSFDEGSDISFTVDAQDADEQNQLSFELLDCSLPAATISSEPESRKAVFKCSPLAIGEYNFRIRVFDDGNPSKDSMTDVSLAINKKRNNQPRIAAKSFDVYAGDPIDFELVATDDDGDAVKITIFEQEQLPDGTLTSVDGESKAIFTNPPIEEVRQYAFQVKLDDGGEPRMRNDQPVDNLERITVNVLPAKFVMASQTKITSIIRLRGVDRAWIDVRPTGEQHDVVVGDTFEVDRKTWTVKSISVDKREIVLQVDNVIKTYRFGDFLSSPRSEEKVSGTPAEENSTSNDEGAESNQAAVVKVGPEPTSDSDK
jgi:hypothetical protein